MRKISILLLLFLYFFNLQANLCYKIENLSEDKIWNYILEDKIDEVVKWYFGHFLNEKDEFLKVYYLMQAYYWTKDTLKYKELLRNLEKIENCNSYTASFLWYIKSLLYRRFLFPKKLRVSTRNAAFIREFYVLGPFENEHNKGYDINYPPEKFPIDITKKYEGKFAGIKIKWRKIKLPEEVSEVPLSWIFSPSKDSLGYILIPFEIEKPGEYYLSLGNSGSIKIWINGKLFFSYNKVRRCFPDQDLVKVYFENNKNWILIKVCNTNIFPWKLCIRFLTTKYTPVKIKIISPNYELLTYSQSFQNSKTYLIKKNPIVEYFKKDLSISPVNRVRFILSSLITDCYGSNPQIIIKEIENLIETSDKNPFYWYLSGIVPRVRARMTAEKDVNSWLLAFKKVLKLYPFAYRVKRKLAEYYLNTWGNFLMAEDIIKGAGVETLELLRVKILHQKGLEQKAFSIMKEIVKKYPDHLPVKMCYLRELKKRHFLDKALEVSQELFELSGSRESLDLIIRINDLIGNSERSINLVKTVLMCEPFNKKYLRWFIDFKKAQGNINLIKDILNTYLNFSPYNLWLLKEKADLIYTYVDNNLGLQLYQNILKIFPTDQSIIDLLNYKGKLKNYYQWFPISTEKFIDRAKSLHTDADSIYIVDRNILKVDKTGLKSSYVRFTIKILKEKGLFKKYPIWYARGEQGVKVLKARIIHPDGTVESLKAPRYKGGSFDDEYRVWDKIEVDCSSLKVNDIFDIEYEVKDIKRSFFGTYVGWNFYFRNYNPVIYSEFIAIVPENLRIYYKIKGNTIKFEKKRKDNFLIYRWWDNDIPKIEKEPRMPSLDEIGTWVKISTFKSWQNLGSWYWNLIKDQLVASDEMKKLVKELTKDKSSDFEKAKAIYEFVIKKIRYVAWEFGVHGFKPYRTDQILKRGFGDCKDKANLICKMMELAGIKAYPVIIKAESLRNKIDMELPLLNYFNHCIAVCFINGKKIFLDGTAIWHPINFLPEMDRDANVLIVEPGNCRLEKTPTLDYRENQLNLRTIIDLTQPQPWELITHFSTKGIIDVICRSVFSNEGMRKKILSMVLSPYIGPSKIQMVSCTSPEDLDTPFEMDFSFIPEKLFTIKDNTLSFSPFLIKADLFFIDAGSTRNYPFLLRRNFSGTTTTIIKLPSSYKVKSLPGSLEIKNNVIKYNLSCTIKKDSIIIKRQFCLLKRRLSPKEYMEYRKAFIEINEKEIEKVKLTKK